jgi:hypothetical protein
VVPIRLANSTRAGEFTGAEAATVDIDGKAKPEKRSDSVTFAGHLNHWLQR